MSSSYRRPPRLGWHQMQSRDHQGDPPKCSMQRRSRTQSAADHFPGIYHRGIWKRCCDQALSGPSSGGKTNDTQGSDIPLHTGAAPTGYPKHIRSPTSAGLVRDQLRAAQDGYYTASAAYGWSPRPKSGQSRADVIHRDMHLHVKVAKQPRQSSLNTHHRQVFPNFTIPGEANDLPQSNRDFFNKISSEQTLP